MNVDAFLFALQILSQWFGRRSRVGGRNVEQQAVGEDSGGGLNREIASGQSFAVHLHVEQAPRPEV